MMRIRISHNTSLGNSYRISARKAAQRIPDTVPAQTAGSDAEVLDLDLTLILYKSLLTFIFDGWHQHNHQQHSRSS